MLEKRMEHLERDTNYKLARIETTQGETNTKLQGIVVQLAEMHGGRKMAGFLASGTAKFIMIGAILLGGFVTYLEFKFDQPKPYLSSILPQ